MRVSNTLVLGVNLTLCACTGTVGGELGNKPNNGPTNTASHAEGDDPTNAVNLPGVAPVGDRIPTDGKNVSPSDGTGGDQGAVDLGPTRLRLLSEFEYNQTLNQLLGGTELKLGVSPSTGAAPFDNDAADLTLGSTLLARYQSLASEGAKALVSDGSQLPDCPKDRDCAKAFFLDFGTRAYRRPITDSEISRLLVLYNVGAVTSHVRGLELAVEGILTSAPFLYRPELGVEQDGRRKLTGNELAGRLSYFFWGLAPDLELLESAEKGELDEVDGIARQAKRLFSDSRSSVSFRHLHRQWLHVDALDGQERSPALGVDFTPSLRSDLKEETLSFLETLLFEKGTVRDIYSAQFSMMNRAVAEHSGVTGPSGEEFERVELDGERRHGLLTHAGLLAAGATYDRTSPIHRGVFVRRQLLCQKLPTPPATIPSIPDPKEGETERERLGRHREDPACAACHALMDPVGFAFENYDPTGRYRTVDDTGQPVDASGELTATAKGSISLDGIGDLSGFLATSAEAQVCLAQQYLRYALGRSGPGDAGNARAIVDSLGPDYRLDDLVTAVVTSDSFRYRDDFEKEENCETEGDK